MVILKFDNPSESEKFKITAAISTVFVGF